jgi:hypothetical protein
VKTRLGRHSPFAPETRQPLPAPSPWWPVTTAVRRTTASSSSVISRTSTRASCGSSLPITIAPLNHSLRDRTPFPRPEPPLIALAFVHGSIAIAATLRPLIIQAPARVGLSRLRLGHRHYSDTSDIPLYQQTLARRHTMAVPRPAVEPSHQRRHAAQAALKGRPDRPRRPYRRAHPTHCRAARRRTRPLSRPRHQQRRGMAANFCRGLARVRRPSSPPDE